MSGVIPAPDEPWDLVAKAHAEEISSGLREAAERIGDSLDGVVVSRAEKDCDGGSANVTDGLFAIARALDRIAQVMEKLNERER